MTAERYDPVPLSPEDEADLTVDGLDQLTREVASVDLLRAAQDDLPLDLEAGLDRIFLAATREQGEQ